MAVWILTGDAENWREALESRGIWGVRPNLERLWERLKTGDQVFFYCKSPTAAIIGFGRVRTKFRQDKPFWPDEVASKTVIYPFRFEFDVDFLLPEDRWAIQGAKGVALGLQRNHISAGLNEIRDESLVDHIRKALAAPRKEEMRTRELSHSNVQQMLFELGKFQRFISDIEYSMDGERLDVVWRRIEKSVPTYVFEVQVGGDVQHALGKLKHAHDLWNSELFIALSDKDQSKASFLLSGTFHEIRDRVKVLKLEDVRRLYELKRDWKEFEQRLGIL
jgi:predicted RNA-binding protein